MNLPHKPAPSESAMVPGNPDDPRTYARVAWDAKSGIDPIARPELQNPPVKEAMKDEGHVTDNEQMKVRL